MNDRRRPVVAFAPPSLLEIGRRVPVNVLAGAAVVGLTAVLVFVLSQRPLVLLAAALGALGLIAYPHVGVLAIFVSWGLGYEPIRIAVFSLTELIGIVLLIPLTLAILRDRQVWVARLTEVRILVGLVVVFVAALAWSHAMLPAAPFDLGGPEGPIPQLRLFVARFLFLIYFLYFIRTPRHLRQFTVILVLLILFAAVDALRLTGGLGLARARSFLVGMADNPNRLAYISIFAASLLWFFRTDAPSSRWRSWTLLLVPLLVFTALLAGSRNGVLQILLFAGLALREQKTLTATRRLYGLFIVGTVAVLAVVMVPTTQWLRATNFDTSLSRPGGQSTQNRITTAKAAIQLTLENPLLGVGPGNFIWHHQSRWGNHLATHNSYLWALTTAGPLFLLLYLALFRRLYRRFRAIETGGPRELAWLGKALRVNLVLFLAYSIFADFWVSIFLYFLVGMAIVMTRLVAEAAADVPACPRPGYL